MLHHRLRECQTGVTVGLWVILAATLTQRVAGETIDLNEGWRFHRGAASGAYDRDYDESNWSTVRLPHTARIEPLVTGPSGAEAGQWQGVCWYRKSFQVAPDQSDKVLLLKFDGAMGEAEVWLNQTLLTRHAGGFLPIVLDITGQVRSDRPNVLAVRLDNHDNGITGPKPLSRLDFNFYGGLYREAQLIVKDRLHITDPILADVPASGGVFVTFPQVSNDLAEARVQTHVHNAYPESRSFQLRTSLLDASGAVVAHDVSPARELPRDQSAAIVQNLMVSPPQLWSPNSPYLYTVRTEILSGNTVHDYQDTRVGARHVKTTKEGLWLNGKKVFLRGTNRHQEYPFIGYALSRNAQFRDAQKIKQAGFDFVRLSHYPHAPAFMDACDELGLLTMNCIMGWQYYSDLDEFKAFQYQQSRDLIRRDRNHPSVLLWEVSLNESGMSREFMETTHAIAHEEYPGDQCYTCGWAGNYDVFIQARQHGGCRQVTERPCMVSEYGDWEYYAQDAGLQQDQWRGLSKSARNSRQDRTDGEQRLMQQALNFQEAHNDNLKTNAFADGLWVMFDYNRGYSNDLEKSGCMDIFRLPKPSYFFFQSQRDPIRSADGSVSAMVRIASHWTADSPRPVKVFSNCDEVALYHNDELVAQQSPDADRLSTHLKHPPFTFELHAFTPGTLRAAGIIGDQVVAQHSVSTAARPSQLRLDVDCAGRAVAAGQSDVVFVHASIADVEGVTVPDQTTSVSFQLQGDGLLIGDNPAPARAGIATVLVIAGNTSGPIIVRATADGLDGAQATIDVGGAG